MILNSYNLLLPAQIVFGWGRRTELPALAKSLGQRVFLIIGSQTLVRQGVIAELVSGLEQSGLTVLTANAPNHEPEVCDVDQLTREWSAHHIQAGDCVIAIGGGSAIDLAKAVAAMLTNPQGDSVQDFLEGVGKGLTLQHDPLPMIAVPTTAGTGSEATKNAVISSYDPPFKKSLRSDRMIPRILLIDPELTVTVPATTTAYTGMDAITQLIESYISHKAAPIPQALCLQGLQQAWPAISRAVKHGEDRAAREAMSHAALLSGIALANSGLGMAHGVAAALGVLAKVPHGLACAVMLPPTLRYNLPVKERELAELGRVCLTDLRGSDTEIAERFIDAMAQVCLDVGIPTRLRDIGVQREQIAALVPASQGNSLSGNPRDVTPGDLQHLLESLW